ncbi:MAG: 2TM domain-containing protein [Bacteroidia bacterium]|jgi:hypothetical protein|nr:2TM domain-containing protein [Bacteroidia bacterium]
MSNTTSPLEQQREKELWKKAKRRVGFRRHLIIYLLVNTFLWCVWFFTGREHSEGFPWPVFPMLGWGIGLAFDFFGAYINNGSDAIEREYEKLKSRGQ